MARYRTKDEADLRWNAIRRGATARLHLEARAWEERRQNEVLSDLWIRYQQGLNEGEVQELDADYGKWIEDALSTRILGKADGSK